MVNLNFKLNLLFIPKLHVMVCLYDNVYFLCMVYQNFFHDINYYDIISYNLHYHNYDYYSYDILYVIIILHFILVHFKFVLDYFLFIRHFKLLLLFIIQLIMFH